MSRPLICIGKVKSAHGIKGEVKIDSYTDIPDTIADYTELYNATGDKVYQMHYRSFAGHYIIASIDDVHTRNDAEALKGTKLYIYRDSLPETEEDEFYYEDLFGLTAELPDGTFLGTIKTVHNFGAGDILEITLDNQTGKTELYPFTKKIVPEVNIKAGKIVVSPPDVTYVQNDDTEEEE